MKISSFVQNSRNIHHVQLRTNDSVHSLEIAPKQSGFGSSANGGELLFLALATCYCNDIYREAGKRGIEVEAVEVLVEGDFGAEGEPASSINYRAKVKAKASAELIRELMSATDKAAEIQNTLRIGVPVQLTEIETEEAG